MVPPNISVQYVEKPTEALVEEAVQVFAKLMPDDLASLSFTGGNISLLPAMGRSMIKPIALIAGEMYTATDENGALVGFTLWLPPGSNVMTSEEQRQMGLYPFMELLSDEAKAYFPEVLGVEFPTFVSESTGIPETELNTWWCSFAFVSADYQGKGLTKAMFELVYEKAKKTGTPMTLSTTNIRNVEIYKRLGFEVKGYKVMKSPWTDWPSWVFLRETKS
ncbi:hypothetical protein B0H21DRAFT_747377 [Amylocystis lapponica]|nr:hypothetical protein B0H21DRAFT_747377 [Amylocystis lapponica]